jgi:hypothetical protein
MGRMNGEVRDREKTMREIKENGYSYLEGLSTIPQLHKRT